MLGATARLRFESAIYKCRFTGPSELGWTFEAPTRQGSPAPIQHDEAVFVEQPAARGALVYRSFVEGRTRDPHRIHVRPPETACLIERRAAKRRDGRLGPCRLDSAPAKLLDYGPGGACVLCDSMIAPGREVDVVSFAGAHEAFVLDCKAAMRAEGKFEIRLVYQLEEDLQNSGAR